MLEALDVGLQSYHLKGDNIFLGKNKSREYFKIPERSVINQKAFCVLLYRYMTFKSCFSIS